MPNLSLVAGEVVDGAGGCKRIIVRTRSLKDVGQGHGNSRHLRMPVRAPLVESDWILAEMAAGLTLPSALMRVATRPAMWGVAIEVPEMLLVTCTHNHGDESIVS